MTRHRHGDGNDGGGYTRRRIPGALGAGVAVAPLGLTGCLGGSGATCPDTGIAVETPEGDTRCVSPIESSRSISDYYGYDRGPGDSSSTPQGFEEDDATVTFLYRDTEAEMLCLVFLNGDVEETSDMGGGNAVMTFEGVEGARWHVQDGRPGSGGGDTDPYGTPDGEFDGSESVVWGWDDSKTDGGAFGPLGDSFDVEVVHRAEGTVDGTTGEREGLDRWLFVDAADPENPVELTSFDGDTGDVSVRVFSTDDG